MITAKDIDRLDIKKWAENQANFLRDQINAYIADGWARNTAVETVLKASNISTGYKTRIRYEFKGK